ncbi:MAG: hypothetical protein P8L85_02960 [Rubripirellula sp.]|nr:hypothetical protein [Rubripirellula sp.]
MDANTVVLINAEKMFGSRLADQEGWAARRKAAYDAGVTALPPDASQVVIAGRHDHEYGHEALWELGLMELTAKRDVSTVALRYGATMDTIDGHSATRLPDDHYVVQLGPTLHASYTPANRQDVVRWLRSTNVTNPAAGLSKYLEQAFTYATSVGTPIVMAMDLEGLVAEAEIERRLASFAGLKESEVPTAKLAALIHGVKGITLGVSIDRAEYGAIRVDFSESPQILAGIGKKILIEVLEKQGAMIEDVREWKPSVEGNAFVLRGNLSSEGTRKVMSILALPASMVHAVQDSQSAGADQGAQAKLVATQEYWNSLNYLLDDLRNDHHFQTFGQGAIWYDKYARKIDHLPILNVDDELVDYGANVASAFRDCEGIMKGVGMKTSLLTAQNSGASSAGYANGSFGGYRANSGYGPSYGPMGVSSGVSAMNASRQELGRTNAIIRGRERTMGASNVQDVWAQLDEANAKMRRTLVNKYSADF